MSPKLTFIVGFPRSGTTWTMWLLANHPRTVTCFHAGLFHALEPLHDWWSKAVPFGKSVYTLDPAQGMGAAGRDGFSKAVLTDLLDSDQFLQHAKPLVEHVFNTIAGCASNPAVIVEKTPENLEFLSWILDLLPDAYILHVIRDPRAAHLSICKSISTWQKSKVFDRNAVRNARQWVRYIETGEELAARTDRYKAVLYEDLLSDGVNQLADIHDWLGLESNHQMCVEAFENTRIEKMHAKKVAPPGFFRKGSAAEWRTELSGRDSRTIEYITDPWLTRLGYPVAIVDQDKVPRDVWFDLQRTRFLDVLSNYRNKVRAWRIKNHNA